MKFAFILNFEGLHPDKYNVLCDKGNNYNMVYGVNDMEETEALVKKLAADGYELINLCSAYDADMTAKVAEAGIRTCAADYMESEAAKLDKVEDFSEYGVIIVDAGLAETAAYELKDPAANTHIRFIRDVEGACEAAKGLVADGVTFIELCSWFDAEKTNAVIKAIDSQVPVGSCGL